VVARVRGAEVAVKAQVVVVRVRAAETRGVEVARGQAAMERVAVAMWEGSAMVTAPCRIHN
jgi:hypothetical protein